MIELDILYSSSEDNSGLILSKSSIWNLKFALAIFILERKWGFIIYSYKREEENTSKRPR